MAQSHRKLMDVALSLQRNPLSEFYCIRYMNGKLVSFVYFKCILNRLSVETDSIREMVYPNMWCLHLIKSTDFPLDAQDPISRT